MLYDSVHMTFLKKAQLQGQKLVITACQRLGVEGKVDYQGHGGTFMGEGVIVDLDCDNGHITTFICCNSQNCTSKRINYTVYY